MYMPKKEATKESLTKESLTVDEQLWSSANTGLALLVLLVLASAVFVLPTELRFFWMVLMAMVVLEMIAFFIYANLAQNASSTAQMLAHVILYGQYILFCVTFMAILIALSVKVYGILNKKTNILRSNELSGNTAKLEEVKIKLGNIQDGMQQDRMRSRSKFR